MEKYQVSAEIELIQIVIITSKFIQFCVFTYIQAAKLAVADIKFAKSIIGTQIQWTEIWITMAVKNRQLVQAFDINRF